MFLRLSSSSAADLIVESSPAQRRLPRRAATSTSTSISSSAVAAAEKGWPSGPAEGTSTAREAASVRARPEVASWTYWQWGGDKIAREWRGDNTPLTRLLETFNKTAIAQIKTEASSSRIRSLFTDYLGTREEMFDHAGALAWEQQRGSRVGPDSFPARQLQTRQKTPRQRLGGDKTETERLKANLLQGSLARGPRGLRRC